MSEDYLQPIETKYRGIRFRSRGEARWAVFFDACNVKWEYEPEGNRNKNICYLPDFLLHNIKVIKNQEFVLEDLYVEVKGKMTEYDLKKINSFSFLPKNKIIDEYIVFRDNIRFINPLIVVGASLPDSIFHYDYCTKYYEGYPPYYSFYNIDYDDYGAYFVKDKYRGLILKGCDYLTEEDEKNTKEALEKARGARFEFGETLK